MAKGRPEDSSEDPSADVARDHRAWGLSFDRVARQYDRDRPHYPRELVGNAFAAAGLRAGDRVLEIGCGSGQLTGDLLAHGLRVTAIEPGANLLALAAERCRGAGDVEFVHARFEEAPMPVPPVVAVFAASSFHWIDPDVGWRRVAAALVPGGTLALVQFCAVMDVGDDQEAMFAALAGIAPAVAMGWPPKRELDAIRAGVEERRANVSEVWSWIGDHEVARAHAAELFDDAALYAVPVRLENTADEVVRVMSTHSFYEQLTPDQRQALRAEYEMLEHTRGRLLRSTLAAVVVTARRAPR